MSERPPLVGRVQRAQQSYWFCTPVGLAEAAAPGLLPAFNGTACGRTTGRRAAAGRGLGEHGLALVDTVLAFHRSGAADAGDWQIEPAHVTPAGLLVPDAVVLLATGAVRVRGSGPRHDVLRTAAGQARHATPPTAPRRRRGAATPLGRRAALAGPLRRVDLERPVPAAAGGVRRGTVPWAPQMREAEFQVRADGPLMPSRCRLAATPGDSFHGHYQPLQHRVRRFRSSSRE